jgi:hypothetical protein
MPVLLPVIVHLTWLCNRHIADGCSCLCAFLLIVSLDPGGPSLQDRSLVTVSFLSPLLIWRAHQRSSQRLQLRPEWLLCDRLVFELYNAPNSRDRPLRSRPT